MEEAGKKESESKTSRGHLIHIWMRGRFATAVCYLICFIDGQLRGCVAPMEPTAWLQHKWKFNPNLTSPS